MGESLLTEIKQLLGAAFQHFAELEDHVEGNTDVSDFDGADMAAVNADQFGERNLG